MPTTSGAVGSWPCWMLTPGQIDCSGTLTAPRSRADVGGFTTWSSVVHSDSHGGGWAQAPASETSADAWEWYAKALRAHPENPRLH